MKIVKRWVLQVLIAIDQLVAAILGGWADETLSSYAWRLEKSGKPWGAFWRPVIDMIFAKLFGQLDHCRKSHLEERNRAQQPPENRQ